MSGTFWRQLAIALITFILGAGATWLNDKDRVNKDQVLQMIHSEAPSQADIKELKEAIVSMQVSQARTDEKLDLLLKRTH